MKNLVPLSADGSAVFIDGQGDVPIDYDRETEWRGMDTAPKDGTLCLAVNIDPVVQNPVVIYWEFGSMPFGIEPHWRSSTHERISAALVTHWRPIINRPKAPAL